MNGTNMFITNNSLEENIEYSSLDEEFKSYLLKEISLIETNIREELADEIEELEPYKHRYRALETTIEKLDYDLINNPDLTAREVLDGLLLLVAY